MNQMSDEVICGSLQALKNRLYARLVELLSACSFKKEVGMDTTYRFQTKTGKCFLVRLTSTMYYDGDVPGERIDEVDITSLADGCVFHETIRESEPHPFRELFMLVSEGLPSEIQAAHLLIAKM